MADRPYIVALVETANANGTVSLSKQMSNQESFRVREMWSDSTGAFNLIDIRDSSGKKYTDASRANPIPSTFMQQPDNDNDAWRSFDGGLVIGEGQTLYFDVLDTSGSSNDVTIVLSGVLTTDG